MLTLSDFDFLSLIRVKQIFDPFFPKTPMFLFIFYSFFYLILCTNSLIRPVSITSRNCSPSLLLISTVTSSRCSRLIIVTISWTDKVASIQNPSTECNSALTRNIANSLHYKGDKASGQQSLSELFIRKNHLYGNKCTTHTEWWRTLWPNEKIAAISPCKTSII